MTNINKMKERFKISNEQKFQPIVKKKIKELLEGKDPTDFYCSIEGAYLDKESNGTRFFSSLYPNASGFLDMMVQVYSFFIKENNDTENIFASLLTFNEIFQQVFKYSKFQSITASVQATLAYLDAVDRIEDEETMDVVFNAVNDFYTLYKQVKELKKVLEDSRPTIDANYELHREKIMQYMAKMMISELNVEEQ
jgi:hypothetical protein